MSGDLVRRDKGLRAQVEAERARHWQQNGDYRDGYRQVCSVCSVQRSEPFYNERRSWREAEDWPCETSRNLDAALMRADAAMRAPLDITDPDNPTALAIATEAAPAERLPHAEVAGLTPETCPGRANHGDPFRYCPVKGCGWHEGMTALAAEPDPAASS
jgi:hypothetical protein